MRVSEHTSQSSVHEALKRTRSRMEELQIKNSTQKNLIHPSDDPAGNAKILDIRTQSAIHSQFEYNATLAKNRLSFTDAALQELNELFVRAKEIALSQSSDASGSPESRLGVAQEVSALYKHLASIANRRVGQHYIFGGFKTQNPPYTAQGQYLGDEGEIPVEIEKNVFVAMNVPGSQIFQIKKYKPSELGRSPAAVDRTDMSINGENNAPPSEQQEAEALETIDLFQELDKLRVGLLTNDVLTIRGTLEPLDRIIESVITLRAKISSRVAGIDSAMTTIQKTDLHNAELVSQIEDADYADLWSRLAREETVLRSSLSAAQKLIQPTLLDFLR